MFNVGHKNKNVKFVNFHVIKENDWLEQTTWHATAMSRASSWAMLIDVLSVNNTDILTAIRETNHATIHAPKMNSSA